MSSKLWDAKAGEVSVEEYAAIEAEERLVYEVQKAVRTLLKQKGVKAAELARLLDVSEARVSQMLGGSAKNLTLRTLARIHHVLGSRCVLRAEDEAPAVQGTAPQKPLEPAKTSGEVIAHEPVSRAETTLGLWTRAGEPVLVAELSDLAAFGKSAVWVLGPEVAPANENERVRSAGAGDEQAKSWLSAPLPYEDVQERLYA